MDPTKTAVEVMTADVESLTRGEIELKVNQLAHFFVDEAGLEEEDHVAILLENLHATEILIAILAAEAAGVYLTPVNHHAKAEKVGYIVDNCSAKVFITSASERLAEVALAIVEVTPKVERRLVVGGELEGHESFEAVLEDQPRTVVERSKIGRIMFYTSGTTGRPKGGIVPLAERGSQEGVLELFAAMLGLTQDGRMLLPGPLYHGLGYFAMRIAWEVGATLLVMEKFNAELALHIIQAWKVTHFFCVPTHMSRMRDLPDEVRTGFDVSSLECVLHTAAICPVHLKESMIEWFGPIFWELYGFTEGGSAMVMSPEEWDGHRGAVGRSTPERPLRITDEDWNPVEPGVPGLIWVNTAGAQFEYFNDPEKTAENRDGNWQKVGDWGYLDDEGYLFVLDRRVDLIISGGVNVYPSEVEAVLTSHPLVADAAVVGITDPDLGQKVWALVKLTDHSLASDDLVGALMALCVKELAGSDVPKVLEIRENLPRNEIGKMLHRELREEIEARVA